MSSRRTAETSEPRADIFLLPVLQVTLDLSLPMVKRMPQKTSKPNMLRAPLTLQMAYFGSRRCKHAPICSPTSLQRSTGLRSQRPLIRPPTRSSHLSNTELLPSLRSHRIPDWERHRDYTRLQPHRRAVIDLEHGESIYSVSGTRTEAAQD